MKRTPWVLIWTTALLAVGIIFFQRAALFDPDTDVAPGLLRGIYAWARPRAGMGIVFLAIGSAFIQALEKAWGIHSFRKETHVKFVDQILLELFQNNGIDNRITLFKAVTWFRAFPTYVRRWLLFGEDRMRLLGMLPLNPLGRYLMVYARCARGTNPQSCSMFRVYSQSPERCEGFAGLVWSTDFAVKRSLPDVKNHMKRITNTGDIRDVTRTRSSLRRYAVESNLTDCAKLRAVNRYAQHFLGTALWTSHGKKWGVLLVDSTAKGCPFPATNPEFEDDFKSYAKSLSHTL